jgi:FlaA1/EpsC-like NDP-sugar epimerase
MINISNIEFIEKKIISKKNRFELNHNESLEINNEFKNKNILIAGASGSIGKEFTKKILKLNFRNLYLLDKNENSLTEINRDIVNLVGLKKIKKIFFICADFTQLNINSVLNKKRIHIFLNFAALKHVRSEEELESIKYMFNTNTKSFLDENIKSNYLKKIFSVSTDKAAYPSSVLGISKFLMEQKLACIKTKNKIFISSARFANVSFSNGSILKNIVKRLINKEKQGIPKNIKRFFITHDEAVSICLKALLKRNDGKIIIPSSDILTKQLSIKDLCIKIINIFNKRTKNISEKKLLKKNNIILTSGKNHGQKKQEVFNSKSEIIINDNFDKKINYLNLNYVFKYDKFLNDIDKLDNMNLLRNKIKKNFQGYINSNVSRVSKSY